MTDTPNTALPAFDLIAALTEWYNVKAEIAPLAQKEGILRKAIFDHCFPAPVEGTNTYVLPDEHQLKGVHVINRNVDDAALDALKPKLAEKQVNIDTLIKRKPELVKSVYNTLNDEQRHLVDQFLVIKEGTPQLSIVPPSKKGAKAPANPTA